MNSVRPILGSCSAARIALSRVGVVVLVMLLASCGFAMRGTTPLPFDSLYTSVAQNTRFGAQLRRAIRATSPNTRIVETAKEAAAQLLQISSTRSLRQVSLNAQGQVEEYELSIAFVFRLIDAKGNALLPDTTLISTHELPYNVQLVQAEQGQIDSVFETMQQSLVDRIVRRITSAEVLDNVAKNKALPATATPASGSVDTRLDPAVVPPTNPRQDDMIPWNQTTVTPVPSGQ
jgi:LPS-assembly lipoprotein